MKLFSAENVTFYSVSAPVIKGITVDIEQGTTTAFLGRSGGGKSTLLKLLAGVLVPASGHIFFEGTEITKMSVSQNRAFRHRCSFVFQDSALWANQDIMQNLMLPLQVHYPQMTWEERQHSVEMMCVKVNYDRPLTLRPSDLSTGEQKRIAFARAMICQPQVLFLDECTESLDQRGTETIAELLHDFLNQGNTILYVSHNSTFIREFPGTIHIIEDGRIKRTTE
jgi:ABC-type lipoprotein export system ATPase subunit